MSVEDWLKVVQFSVRLTRKQDRQLRLWARLKNMKRATLAANTIAARIEANQDWIDNEIAEIARLEGVSVEEVEERLLKMDEDSGDG